MELNEITEAVIGCAMKVSSTLGTGFLEKVYENALAIEMKKAGLSFGQQESVKVLYEGGVRWGLCRGFCSGRPGIA